MLNFIPLNRTLTIHQGADFVERFQIVDKIGTPVDVSGFSFASQMRRSPYSRQSYTLDVEADDGVLGWITVRLAKEVTLHLSPGRHVYDIHGTQPGNEETPESTVVLLRGGVNVNKSVTLPDSATHSSYIPLLLGPSSQFLKWDSENATWIPVVSGQVLWNPNRVEITLSDGSKFRVTRELFPTDGSYYYVGDPDTDNTLRFSIIEGRISNPYHIEQRVSGSWQTIVKIGDFPDNT